MTNKIERGKPKPTLLSSAFGATYFRAYVIYKKKNPLRPFCLRAARLLNRRKWERRGYFGKPMHELRLPCPADPPKK